MPQLKPQEGTTELERDLRATRSHSLVWGLYEVLTSRSVAWLQQTPQFGETPAPSPGAALWSCPHICTGHLRAQPRESACCCPREPSTHAGKELHHGQERPWDQERVTGPEEGPGAERGSQSRQDIASEIYLTSRGVSTTAGQSASSV